MKVLLIGGNGGIGIGLLNALLARGDASEIHATYNRVRPSLSHDSVKWHQLDVTCEEGFKELASKIDKVDLLINCVGMLHTKEYGPEKTIRSIEPDFFMNSFRINTLPSLLIAKHFSRSLLAPSPTIFAVISAKVGSIEDNRLGGWYSYRASKAALNMALKTLALEWRLKVPNCCIAALHPGTTDTQLSKPYQVNVPDGKLFTASHTASLLIEVIEGLTPKLSGRFWDWSGKELPW